MSEPIHLSFRYSEADFVRAMRLHYATRLRLRRDLAVVLATAAAGTYLVFSGSPTLGLVTLSIACAFVLMVLAAFTILPRMAYRREPKFKDEYALTFSDEGIRFRTAHLSSELEWSLYSRALIDAASIVLYYGRSTFTIIPTRVFASLQDRESFERLVAARVPTIVRGG